MTKWQERLKFLAEQGNQAADDIYWETKDMNEAELAAYLAANDEQVRSVLQLKYLAEKDADPELNREYYDLLNKGQMAFQGEGRFDPYGQKPLSVEDYMEKFGVEKGPGGYSDDQVAAFTNPENRDYFMKIKSPEQLEQIASWLSMGNSERLVEDMRRAADSWQRRNRIEGYDANNRILSSDANYGLDWVLSALKGFTLPRVKEAQLDGREVTWQDVTGDMVELGLNFIPGVGIVSKSGKVVAALPKIPGAALKTGAYAVDVGAVPALSQAYDVGVNRATGRDVPRADWDWERMGAQAAMMGTGKATLKSTARMGKDIMEGSLGEKAGGAEFNAGKGFIENIGEKTDDQIARRQAMLDRKAELAMKRENVALEGDRDIASSKGPNLTPQDIADAENYRILTGEAERLARSDAERQAYRQAASRQEARERVFRPDYSRDAEGNVVRGGNMAVPTGKGGYEFTWSPDSPHNFESTVRAVEGVMNADADQAAANAYRAVNEAGAPDIVMLDDGRFVRADRVRNGEVDFGQDYPYPKTGYRSAEFTYDPNLPPSDYTAPGVTFLDGATVKPVDRNVAVKAAIEKEPELARKLAGTSTYAGEVARDVVASVLFTGAAHNDLFGKLGGLESKRADAWWNAQMKKLGELTSSNTANPKVRQQNFEAIMDAMTYGLDNVPVDKFRKRPEAYHAVAAKLGYPGWMHPSEMPDIRSSASAATSSTPESSSSAY